MKRWHTSKDRSRRENLAIDVSRGPESQLAPRRRNARPTIVSCAAAFHQDSPRWYPSSRYYFPSDRRPARPCRPDDWATSHRIYICKGAEYSLAPNILRDVKKKKNGETAFGQLQFSAVKNAPSRCRFKMRVVSLESFT